MSVNIELAKHLRQVYFGGNWASTNLKDTLSDVNWQEATTKIYSFNNTIAVLFYHVTYYVSEVTKVFKGGPLTAKDKYSFDHPPISSQADWDALLNKAWLDAELFASLLEQMPEDKVWEDFTDKKYGKYYGNVQGIIEHIHYHLGQIVLMKKILALEK